MKIALLTSVTMWIFIQDEVMQFGIETVKWRFSMYDALRRSMVGYQMAAAAGKLVVICIGFNSL